MSSEMWKPIPDFDAYEVSSLGRIRRGQRVLAGHTRKDGYTQVHLWKNNRQHTRRVNRLVCEAFHGSPPFPEAEALHKDHNRSNNAEDNLRWGTSVENSADILEAGRGNNTRGSAASWSKLTEAQVLEIRHRREQETIASLAKEYGVSNATIVGACTKNWQHV